VGRLVTLLVAALMTSGAIGVLVGLIKAFGAVGGESVDPSQKARILAEGISEAMNCTALIVAIWVPSVIALVLTRKRRGAAGSTD
jgi:biopolymer transport protein ExbB/TolQ